MSASGGRIIGTSIIVMTLHAAIAARAETIGDGASVAAAMPFVLTRPATAEVPNGPQDGGAEDAAPASEPDAASSVPDSETTRESAKAEPLAHEEEAESRALARSAIEAALRARLEARAEPSFEAPRGFHARREREAIAAFYAGRDFAPLWYVEGKPIAAALPVIARLRRAADDGLDLSAFPLAPMDGTAAAAIAAADIALTDAVVAYGRQASGSRVDPGRISRLIGARPEVADPAIVLALVATAGEQAGEVLHGFNPKHPAYVALRERLEELRRRRPAAARATSIPEGPVLRVGMHDPRVPLVRARLSLDDRNAGDSGKLYDTKVAAAVTTFQKVHGLPGSGQLTAQTIAVLSGARPSQIEAEIVANMERWRWMPRDLGATRIEVNIPDYEAIVVENGTIVQRHRVVVGKEKTPTPIFSEAMRYLIVNPYWNIPPSIIRNEYASSPGRLRSHGYQVFSRDGQLAARQPPGEKNALGRIKFMFPNAYSVYIHDTPSRALFGEARRAFSHGCVRVDDPFRFAETVLGKGWSKARLEKLIGGKERYLNLPQALPVHIQYFTAFVDETGQLQTREDIYGYSRRVRAALGLEG